jgi:hypothetical protein
MTDDELRAERHRLRHQLDDLRQQDNKILFDQGNPPERDGDRVLILDQMKVTLGKLQEVERLLENARGMPSEGA